MRQIHFWSVWFMWCDELLIVDCFETGPLHDASSKRTVFIINRFFNGTGNFPDECQWERTQGNYIGSTTYITMTVVTVDMCKEACEKETTFHCKGFDYLLASKNCYLKMASRYGTKLNKNAGYDNYERNCYGKKNNNDKVMHPKELRWECIVNFVLIQQRFAYPLA